MAQRLLSCLYNPRYVYFHVYILPSSLPYSVGVAPCLTGADLCLGVGPSHIIIQQGRISHLWKGVLTPSLSLFLSTAFSLISPGPVGWSGRMSAVLVADYPSGGCMLPELDALVSGVSDARFGSGWVDGRFMGQGWSSIHVYCLLLCEWVCVWTSINVYVSVPVCMCVFVRGINLEHGGFVVWDITTYWIYHFYFLVVNT